MRNSALLRVIGLAVILPTIAAARARAQNGEEPPDVTPAPRPALPQQYYPRFAYGPLEAAEEARRRADEAGREAIGRQLQIQEDVRWMNTWAPSAYRASLPYIYAYAPRVGRRVERVFERWVDPVFAPWPRVPGDIYGYPYYPPVKQPIGYDKIWTGPNSYVYRPRYAPSAPSGEQPGATMVPAEPEVLPPVVPEPIPVPPPVKGGPREF